MSAVFKLKVGSEEGHVMVNDDLSITSDNYFLASLAEARAVLHKPAHYEPYPAASLAEYLVTAMAGSDLQVERPEYLDDPPGVVY